ncbi:MAG TPA: response regulator transcription factor [Microbacterium sp.]|nr:response regulator transcription factor [Microbacterium sp.]
MTRVLIVEDEPDLADPLAYLLRREGYEVEIAEDGPSALVAYRDRGADIVLLDLMLPGMSGTEVCRQIRATSRVPIIMLTAKDSEVDIVVGLELGADDYVTKPFSLRELMARIRSQLRRLDVAAPPSAAASNESATVALGDVSVDLAGHRILRGGGELPIKPKAFELLAFLIRNPGQVFSRDRLLEHVWGYDYAGETRTVDVHVHWLRSAIEEDPGQPRFLQTVRGVGYVLRMPAPG